MGYYYHHIPGPTGPVVLRFKVLDHQGTRAGNSAGIFQTEPYKDSIMDTFTPSGISRRDLNKLLGAGALGAMLPKRGEAALLPEFEAGKGQSLIFVVGDGMPSA